ncbi:MAG: hypothetical protein IID16_08955 [Candidatus Marinimicrobia bacterium]|nr:hypothetical protein [Candidatus Neomarinimicrobiota bacterium]
MMQGIRFKLIITFLLLLTIFQPNALALRIDRVNLYILEFDNLHQDPSIVWLSSGLADMLRKEFMNIDGVRLFGKRNLEEILQDRSRLLRQPSGTRNILLMGNFSRSLDQISINVQLINIANWEELGRVTTIGFLNQMSQLNQNLFLMVQEKLAKHLPPKVKRGDLITPEAQAKVPEYRRQVKDINLAMSTALEELEESMDYYIGTREKVDKAGDKGGKFYRDFTFGERGIVESPAGNAELLESIVEKISDNPYHIDIEEPIIEIDKDEKDNVKLILPINYSLREDVIKDMLHSLPYTALIQDGNLTTLEFSRRKFGIPHDLVERISQGNFRVVPVIQILDRNGDIKVVILDTPDPEWYKKSSDKVVFFASHAFSPLIVISISGWSLQVTMESVEINARYQLELFRKEVSNFSRIAVEFVPESELDEFLREIM